MINEASKCEFARRWLELVVTMHMVENTVIGSYLVTISFVGQVNKPERVELDVKYVHDLRRRHQHITV